MARWSAETAVALEVSEAPIVKGVPRSGRVWAPKRWRGRRIAVISGRWSYVDGYLHAQNCRVKIMSPRAEGGGIVVSAAGLNEVVLAPLGGLR